MFDPTKGPLRFLCLDNVGEEGLTGNTDSPDIFQPRLVGFLKKGILKSDESDTTYYLSKWDLPHLRHYVGT